MEPVIISILICFFVHWVADFCLQTDWEATNKSKNNKALFSHVAKYALCFIPLGWKFALAMFVTHFITDYITSRISSYYYDKNRGMFFTVIGFDQFVHQATIILLIISML